MAITEHNYVLTYFYEGQGFFTQDLALKLESGGYRVTGRLNNAIRIQGLWLDVASIEDQMVNSAIGCTVAKYLHNHDCPFLFRTKVMIGL